MKDKLFILRPGFFKEADGPVYCGDSVSVEGLLSFCPQLRDAVDVAYIDAPRPRKAIVELIGADNQSAPGIVLGEGHDPNDASVTRSGTQRDALHQYARRCPALPVLTVWRRSRIVTGGEAADCS